MSKLSDVYILFKRKFSVDKTVTFASLTSVTPMVTGLITVLLVANLFSPELQGYYYTFGSLTALQYLFEMGLGQAIIQFASHEWASLELSPQGLICGDNNSLSRLVSLGRQAIRWYLLLAIFVWILLSCIGLFFFSSKAPGSEIHWVAPWLSLCFFISLNLFLMPIFYLLQGCNQVAEYWFYRFIQQILNGLTLWIAISVGAKLWAAPVAASIGLLWSLVFLFRWYKNFIASFFLTCGTSIINWRKEVWPVQWKIMICWFSVYFTPQLFVPMLFKLSGPVVAGQMGIMVTVGGVLLSLASNWVVTKAPLFGMLIAKRKYEELDAIFFKSFNISLVVATLSSIMVIFTMYILTYNSYSIVNRLLPLSSSAIYIGANIATIASVNLSTYLRAHKREPLALVFILSTACIVISTYLLCMHYSALGIAMGYLIALLLIQLPLTILVFNRCRVVWH